MIHGSWNAAKSFASYLDARPELYRGRSVLEVGAGGGLPGLVAAKNGAECVRLIFKHITTIVQGDPFIGDFDRLPRCVAFAEPRA